jgi:hypothetical protein
VIEETVIHTILNDEGIFNGPPLVEQTERLTRLINKNSFRKENRYKCSS